MTDEQSFLWSICAAPADDTPRLVFADWLDEHGGSKWCPDCAGSRFAGKVHDACPGGWSKCGACGGSERVSDGLRQRAEFIRVQIADGDAAPSRLFTRSFADRWGVGPAWRHTIHRHTMVADYRAAGSDALFSRGFVAEVRCDLATLLGGPCPCGYGRSAAEGWAYRCDVCKNDRDYRTEGVAKALFAAHPVTAVVLTDCEPYSHTSGGRVIYGWSDGDHDPVTCRSHIPPSVWLALDGHNYPTPAAATEALSRAVVAHCRELAGLPQLEV